MSGLLLLVVGLAALAATGTLAACCLGLRSPLELVLAAYLISWTWLVAASLLLSPWRFLTRGSLLAALGAGLGLALGAWLASGRPSPPPFGPALREVRIALRNGPVALLAVVVALGAAYLSALAFFTPANDWDALAYHLPRAAFWRQEHGVGYIEHVADSRLNVNPPNAEIGQLSTMLLSGSDRYVALPQFLAYGALALCVAGLARRIGLTRAEAVFAALAFATLPVVALQASGALNDLVVASFLAVAVLFGLGAGIASLALFGTAVALALGAKFTALLALPTLAVVVAVGNHARRWWALALAGIGGLAAGSLWYVVNAIETGELDGGSAEEFDQRAEPSATGAIARGLRLALSFIETPGVERPAWVAAYLAAAGATAIAGFSRIRRSRHDALVFLGAAAVVVAVAFTPFLVWDVGVRLVYKVGLYLDQDDLLALPSWELNTKADPLWAWYGPLAPVLLIAGTTLAVTAWRKRSVHALALALAAAPWLLVGTVAFVVTWDPWRGRFIIFGMALAAATWGLVLRLRVASAAFATIGSVVLLLALANYYGKWSGLLGGTTVWGKPRWEAQTLVNGPRDLHRFVEENVPADARIGVALTGNAHLYPVFGASMSRRVSLVAERGAAAPVDVDWLVLAPGAHVRRCRDAWRADHAEDGWRVERRVAPDRCFSDERGAL